LIIFGKINKAKMVMIVNVLFVPRKKIKEVTLKILKNINLKKDMQMINGDKGYGANIPLGEYIPIRINDYTYVGQYRKDDKSFKFFNNHIKDLNLTDYDFDVFVRIHKKAI